MSEFHQIYDEQDWSFYLPKHPRVRAHNCWIWWRPLGLLCNRLDIFRVICLYRWLVCWKVKFSSGDELVENKNSYKWHSNPLGSIKKNLSSLPKCSMIYCIIKNYQKAILLYLCLFSSKDSTFAFSISKLATSLDFSCLIKASCDSNDANLDPASRALSVTMRSFSVADANRVWLSERRSVKLRSTCSHVEDWALKLDWRFSIWRSSGRVAVKFK